VRFTFARYTRVNVKLAGHAAEDRPARVVVLRVLLRLGD
jgi:hypothetical protein